MSSARFYVGIDIAAESLTAAVFSPAFPAIPVEGFANHLDGFSTLIRWLSTQGASTEQAVVCLEATGVYGEALCYFLQAQGYAVAVEAPQRVKRAFHQLGKNDRVDAQQIAEYAYRFEDALAFWQPPKATVEQLQTLLTLREKLVTQATAIRHELHSLQRKVVQTPLALEVLNTQHQQLRQHLQRLEAEIQQLIDNDPTFQEYVSHLCSIPGVGLWLAANLLVVTEGFQKTPTASQLAAYLGVAPFEHSSGTSVYRHPRSRRTGPPRLRKLLYLAAMSLRTHCASFKKYFLRKVAEGKSPRLVLNNIANKLIRLICAVLRTRQDFIENYHSVNPRFLKKTAAS